MDIKQILGNRVRELRKKNKLSQEKLAYIAELDRTYINSIENGRRNVSINNIKKIADAFGISMKDFFDSESFADKR